MIHPKEMERLLSDSKESTLTVEDELAFIRLMLRCLASEMSYAESLECVFVQLGNHISGI